jgi:hypothetical protein
VSGQRSCEHLTLTARCSYLRLVKETGGPPIGFNIGVTVQCAACGEPFCFTGLQPGLERSSPTVSTDYTEAQLPMLAASQALASRPAKGSA